MSRYKKMGQLAPVIFKLLFQTSALLSLVIRFTTINAELHPPQSGPYMQNEIVLLAITNPKIITK